MRDEGGSDIRSSAIGIATMTNGGHIDKASAIIHRVDNAIVADPQPPQIPLAAQFSAAGWPRFNGEASDPR